MSTAAPTIAQTVITQTLPPNTHLFATSGTEQIVAAPPQVLLSVPPPQILPQTQLVLTPQVSLISLFVLFFKWLILGPKRSCVSTSEHFNNSDFAPATKHTRQHSEWVKYEAARVVYC